MGGQLARGALPELVRRDAQLVGAGGDAVERVEPVVGRRGLHGDRALGVDELELHARELVRGAGLGRFQVDGAVDLAVADDREIDRGELAGAQEGRDAGAAGVPHGVAERVRQHRDGDVAVNR
ncbi:hypothetical protein D3C72_1027690 [compost metagenome]